MRRRTTITDIAARTGVSKTTVSFAFNAPDKISTATLERVLEAAEELGYVPDPIARTLATKRIGSIGLLLPQPIQEVFKNPYMFELLRGIGSVCHAEDLSLTILPPFRGLLSQTVRNALVDALVTIGIGADEEILHLIRRRHIPFVTIDGYPADGVLNVGIDDEGAAYSLMAQIVRLGHTRIVVIAFGEARPDPAHFSLERSGTVSRRLTGFDRALAEGGLPQTGAGVPVLTCEASMQAAEEAASAALSAHPRPTAIVCLSDVAALGVYAACRARGLRIPADVSVAGFDDVPLAAGFTPSLTTVRQSGYDKGLSAARLVLDSLRGVSCADLILGAELVIRESTGPVGAD